MRRLSKGVAAAAIAVIVTATNAHADTGWNPGEHPVTGSAALTGVTTVDRHTTWAYGMRIVREGKVERHTPLLLTRDTSTGDRRWREVPVPAFGDTGNRISEVDAVNARDAWMVSDYEEARGGVLTAHWDGTAWQQVTVPVPAGRLSDGGLLDVSARAAGDVWAVGWVRFIDREIPNPDKPGGVITETHSEALVTHWDGTAWSVVAVPDQADYTPASVAAVAEDDVWVSGYTNDDTPVVYHYDGATWSRVTVPYDGVYGELVDLEVRGPNDIWAAGRVLPDEDSRGEALLAHWNGRSWKQVPAPAGTGPVNDLTLTPGGVAVVGRTPADEGVYGLRLDAAKWRSLDVPATSTPGSMRYVDSVTWSPRGFTATGSDIDVTGLYTPVLLSR